MNILTDFNPIFLCFLGYTIITVECGEFQVAEQERLLFEVFKECLKKRKEDPVVLTGVFCNRTFDNILCWDDAPAGKTVKQHCPPYINGFNKAEYATRTCMDDGTWYINPSLNKSWTNFSRCGMEDEKLSPLIKEHMPRVKQLFTVGYSFSLAALVLAIFIMLYFRKLRCPRNLIHVNLFLVYTIRAFISLLKEVLLVNDIGFPDDVTVNDDGKYMLTEGSHWGCKMFFTFLNYIILTSILWIFVEGLYLQLLLTLTVRAKKIKLWWYVVFGWGAPVVFVIPWGVTRYFLDDSYCWNVSYYRPELFWIINGPIVISVIITFLIFVNILRLLFTKLTAANCSSSRRYRYRRLAKSTLILIPLFAVYYMGFIWLPDDLDLLAQLIRIYIEMLFNSFQGMLVALLFCFFNSEVQNEIKKNWYRRVLNRGGSFNYKSSKTRHSSRSFNSETDAGYYSKKEQKTESIMNGHLSDIREESVPLNLNLKMAGGGSQDHNDNIQESYDNHNSVPSYLENGQDENPSSNEPEEEKHGDSVSYCNGSIKVQLNLENHVFNQDENSSEQLPEEQKHDDSVTHCNGSNNVHNGSSKAGDDH
ncbi:secretin receptor [Patella vulgata]|uniref:secretin receptor n=1 Tax=Patella vulgata TaxID=6465 RepID=UPI0024A9F69F|nr:secretin receptor [Patella vulgata]XP_050418975.2 secretin receptor [Patella vulgata]XP_055959462.1 secretin receptor [Patella vulgata]